MNDKNKQKNCPVCNKTFAQKGKGNYKTCSEECSKINLKNKQKNWRSWPSAKNKNITEKKCKLCNKTYKIKSKQFCSNKCKIITRNIYNRFMSRISDIKSRHFINHQGKYIDLLGTSIYKYVNYIETFFNDNLNWDNLQEWQIDHIIPICEFDLSDKNQVKKAFHYSNTQPLLYENHIIKTTDHFLENYYS